VAVVQYQVQKCVDREKKK